MKNMKKFAALALCAAMTASMMGAVTVSANDSGVESIDDLAGKKIGVQLGTTGDTYVTDEYEGDDAGTKIERFNKANDTVMALPRTGFYLYECLLPEQQYLFYLKPESFFLHGELQVLLHRQCPGYQ